MGSVFPCFKRDGGDDMVPNRPSTTRDKNPKFKRNLLKQLAIILRFIYCVRAKIELRRYVLQEAHLMTLYNAKNDELAQSKEKEVVEISKQLKKYKDKGAPFKDGIKQTFKGMTKLPNGDKYQGNWIEGEDGQDIIHGKGVYIYENGSQFSGYFQNQKIVGDGRIIFYNGDIYEGDIVDEEYNGDGKYIFGDNHKVVGFYLGKFSHNKPTGGEKLNVSSKKLLGQLFKGSSIKEVKEEEKEE